MLVEMAPQGDDVIGVALAQLAGGLRCIVRIGHDGSLVAGVATMILECRRGAGVATGVGGRFLRFGASGRNDKDCRAADHQMARITVSDRMFWQKRPN